MRGQCAAKYWEASPSSGRCWARRVGRRGGERREGEARGFRVVARAAGAGRRTGRARSGVACGAFVMITLEIKYRSIGLRGGWEGGLTR